MKSKKLFIDTEIDEKEFYGCQHAFNAFADERTGVIHTWDLKNIFESLGYHPSETQMFSLISSIGKSLCGKMSFDQFMQIVEEQKNRQQARSSSSLENWINAFIACGADDRDGVIDKSRLIKIIESDFGLQVDLDQRQRVGEGETTSTDDANTLQFDDFMRLLS